MCLLSLNWQLNFFGPNLPGTSIFDLNTKIEFYDWNLDILISLGSRFQLKLTILIFLTKFAQKGYFWSIFVFLTALKTIQSIPFIHKKCNDFFWLFFFKKKSIFSATIQLLILQVNKGVWWQSKQHRTTKINYELYTFERKATEPLWNLQF